MMNLIYAIKVKMGCERLRVECEDLIIYPFDKGSKTCCRYKGNYSIVGIFKSI
jgi:hypothetical protein